MTAGQSIFDAIVREEITSGQTRELLQGLVGIAKIRELEKPVNRTEMLEQRINR